MKRIYLDHAAAAPIDKEALKKLLRTEQEVFGNPSALHAEGLRAAEVIKEARKTVASLAAAKPENIVFTGSGTEANALALFGAARHAKKTHGKNHLILSAIEHPSGIECAEKLREEGFEVDYLPVSREGLIEPSRLKMLLKPETVLVSVIYANNEIGTVQPVREVAKVLRAFRKETSGDAQNKNIQNYPRLPYLHIDACQAVNYLEINVVKLGVDLMSWNSSKVYGPKGVGALFVRSGVILDPLIYGGGQEHDLRSGTENVAGISSFALAMKKAAEASTRESKRLTELRDYFIKRVLAEIPGVVLNGSQEMRLPNNVNFSFPGKDAEEIVVRLDAEGVAASTRSACSSQSEGGSYVVRALASGEQDEQNEEVFPFSSVRFSLGRETKKADISKTVDILKKIIEKF